MAQIAGITGKQFVLGTKAYEPIRYQYATSSLEDHGRMSPHLIIQPASKADIAATIRHAKAAGIAIAVRTGGHQYSGASSTLAPNIQLDLRKAFRGPDDQVFFEAPDGKAYIRTSVSWSLGTFHEFMKKHHVFVPHGQCVNVHIGGHVQTGGYGQLCRSFGLLGDYVTSLEIVDAAGEFREVTKATDAELFWALLGGSPGNLGVITHFTVQVLRDRDYVGSMGVRSLFFYDTKTLNRLLDMVAEMGDDETVPRNYDLTVSVLSSSNKLLDFVPEVDDLMRKEYPDIYGADGLPFWPRMILVYAQWVPFAASDRPDTAWFDRVRHGSLFHLPAVTKPMSEMSGDWLFRNIREFDHAYIKRTHCTASRDLRAAGWAAWLTRRIDAIVKPAHNRCWLAAQVQAIGGVHSQFWNNRNNGTALSWRDSTVLYTLDCFFEPEARQTAVEWHAVNDREAIGPGGVFSETSRKVLWGSWGDFDLHRVWKDYYEDEEKYERLRAVRRRVDPDGVFTPNTFCVKR